METKENKMGVMPVGRLLVNMAGPMILSMLVQALYNVVDSVFVAQISEDALGALTIAFPMQNLMIAIGTGLGVGLNAMISRSLGERRRDMAERYAAQGILLEFSGFLIFLLLGIFAVGPFIAAQANGISRIEEYGVTYLRICCLGSFAFFAQITMERILQSTGRTMLTMVTQITGALVNVFLDWVLIFDTFGTPALGVAGAAIATVVGQCVAASLALFFNITRNHDVSLHLHYLRPNWSSMQQILSISIPSILMVSIGSIMLFCINKILIVFSSTAMAVFGVYFRLQSVAFMPIFGLNNGLVPIVSYNYGARKRERVERSILLSYITAESIMLVVLVIFQIFPDKLLLFFNASQDMINIGVTSLRILSTAFLLAGICVVSSSVCQALSKGHYSLIIAFGRQIVVLVPVAFFLAQLRVLSLVWLAWPIAEFVSLALSLLYVRRTLKRLDWTPVNEAQ